MRQLLVIALCVSCVLFTPHASASSSDQQIELTDIDRMKLDLAAELLATVGAKPEVQERHLVKVVELADAILAQEPENSLVLFNQGLALHRLKSGSGDETFQRVVAIASKAIARSPNDDKQYNVRGVAYAQLKKYDQAKADLRRAIELNPQEKQLQLDLRTVEYDEQVAAGGH